MHEFAGLNEGLHYWITTKGQRLACSKIYDTCRTINSYHMSMFQQFESVGALTGDNLQVGVPMSLQGSLTSCEGYRFSHKGCPDGGIDVHGYLSSLLHVSYSPTCCQVNLAL